MLGKVSDNQHGERLAQSPAQWKLLSCSSISVWMEIGYSLTYNFRMKGFHLKMATRVFRESLDLKMASSINETTRDAHRSPSFVIMDMSWAGRPAKKNAVGPAHCS